MEKTTNILSRNYRIILRKEPEGVYTAFVPALTGCITFGETVEHAIEMAKEAIEGYIELLIEMGEEIPDDTNTLEYSIHFEKEIGNIAA